TPALRRRNRRIRSADPDASALFVGERDGLELRSEDVEVARRQRREYPFRNGRGGRHMLLRGIRARAQASPRRPHPRGRLWAIGRIWILLPIYKTSHLMTAQWVLLNTMLVPERAAHAPWQTEILA